MTDARFIPFIRSHTRCRAFLTRRLPKPVAAIQWWAPDDSATSLRVPIYGGATRVPYHFADATGQVPAAAVAPGKAPAADALRPSLDSAFWIWNLVSNLAYGDRADVVSRALQAKLLPAQERLMAAAAKEDASAAAAAVEAAETKASPVAAEAAITRRATVFCEETADGAFHEWQTVFLELFALTRDGFTVTPSKAKKPQCAAGQKEGCTARYIPDVLEQGYEQSWYDRVASDGENAERYGAPLTQTQSSSRAYEMHKRLRMNKRRAPPRGPPRDPPLSTGSSSSSSSTQ